MQRGEDETVPLGGAVRRFLEQAGQGVLQFEYRRPWETGVPAAKTVRYPVTVQ